MSGTSISFVDPTSDSQITVPATPGTPVGISFDQLGGFEFQQDTLLFPSFQADTTIDINGWYFSLEDESGFILLESGQELLQERQA